MFFGERISFFGNNAQRQGDADGGAGFQNLLCRRFPNRRPAGGLGNPRHIRLGSLRHKNRDAPFLVVGGGYFLVKLTLINLDLP
jgi:hypothetical protein